jgi:hypothetical protein
MSILKVNTIQDKGGNNLLVSDGAGTISSGGLMTMTPAFHAYLSSNYSISNATLTTVPCDSVIYNSGDYNTSTYQFKPSVLGKYYLYGQIHIIGDLAGTADSLLGFMYKHDDSAGVDIEIQSFIQGDYSSSDTKGSVNVIVAVDHTDVNDYYTIRGMIRAGAGRSFGGNVNGALCTFGGYRIIGA